MGRRLSGTICTVQLKSASDLSFESITIDALNLNEPLFNGVRARLALPHVPRNAHHMCIRHVSNDAGATTQQAGPLHRAVVLHRARIVLQKRF